MAGKGVVIVVGAGVAGIAAARTLQDAGWTVRVVEGRERIGGRTHTDSSLGADIDLGAAWIHGPHGNPLTPLAERFGVGVGYTDFNNEFGDSLLAFAPDGRPLDMAAYTRGGQQWRGAINHLFGSILHPEPPAEVRSMADLYRFGLPGPDPTMLEGDEKYGYYYASRVRPQYEDASDLELMDWRLGEAYIKLPGGDLLLHGGGYKKLVAGLAEGLEIALGTVVYKIAYSKDGVQLTTSKGEMTAAQVIVTVPLGVLQAGSIVFAPALPAEKLAAIGRMGMGFYEKIALKFPHIFWPLIPHRLNYLAEGEPELYNAWLNNAHYSGQPILISYHAGSRARYTNQMDDEGLIDGCMETLRKMFGRAIPDPIAYARSGWEMDPFSRGSYSFQKVGSEAGDRMALARPVDGRLFFAGEATHPHYFATVHGAYETGVRAAREAMA